MVARRGVLLVIGLVTATPAVAIVVPSDLARQYDIDVTDPSVVALLQHRGGLQAVLGVALVIAAWRASWVVPACLAAVLTKTLFLSLILGDAQVRAGFPPLPLVFDAIAVAVLIALLAERAVHRAGA